MAEKLLMLAMIALCSYSSSAFAWTTWIGVLEDWPVKDASKPEQATAYESRVRPLFVKVDLNSWKPAPKLGDENPLIPLPKTITWDVCFSGRGEGGLTAMLADKTDVSVVPPYALRPEDKAPWRTRRSLDYAGWIPAPVYKPIILSSSLNSSCKDPEKWRGGPGDKAKVHLQKMLELTVQELASVSPQTVLKQDTARVPRAWGTPKHGRFAVLRAKTTENKDINATFYIGEEGPRFVGFDAMMIDAGDFDNNGASEVVFKRREDKKDIYSLFVRGEKVTEIEWTYP